MDVGRDRANGGGLENDGGTEESDGGSDLDLRGAIEDAKSETAKGDPEIASFLDDEDDGDTENESSDVDAVFEEFEEGSVEEVIAADEEEEDEELKEATDDDIKSLFGDLSTVELDPDEETTSTGGGTTAASAKTEPPSADGTDAGGSGSTADTTATPPDPEETANEVEGLFDDLSGIDVPDESGSSAGTAETKETVLDTGEDGMAAFTEEDETAFQWLGEDVHVFSPDEADVDAVFDEYEAHSVEELIGGEEPVGVAATAMYDEVEAGRSPDGATGDGVETTTGWATTDDAERTGVDANELYDSLEDGPAVVGDDPAADDLGIEGLDPEDELDLELDGSDEATSEPSAGTAVEEGTTTPSVDGPIEEAEAAADAASEDLEAVTPDLAAAESEEPIDGESDVDAIFERFDESTPEEVIAAADASTESGGAGVADETVERLFGDLSEIELETEAPGDAEETTTGPEPGSEAAESEVEGLLGDLSGVTVEADAPGEPPTGTTAEPRVGPMETGGEELLERTGADTHVAVGESDVDALFERFEEGSPEEILDSVEDDEGATDAADPSETDGADGGTASEQTTAEPESDDDPGADDASEGDEEETGGIVSSVVGFVSKLFGR
jgi:hypothetical protein